MRSPVRATTLPGGALTALAFVLMIGKAERFQCGKQVGCYLGLVPLEDSSGDKRRLGHITKQGNSLLRFLLVEAAQVTSRTIPEWRSKYLHLTMRRGRKIAKVAMARKLAIRIRREFPSSRKRGLSATEAYPRCGFLWRSRRQRLRPGRRSRANPIGRVVGKPSKWSVKLDWRYRS